jgi:hypothetical protein
MRGVQTSKQLDFTEMHYLDTKSVTVIEYLESVPLLGTQTIYVDSKANWGVGGRSGSHVWMPKRFLGLFIILHLRQGRKRCC